MFNVSNTPDIFSELPTPRGDIFCSPLLEPSISSITKLHNQLVTDLEASIARPTSADYEVIANMLEQEFFGNQYLQHLSELAINGGGYTLEFLDPETVATISGADVINQFEQSNIGQISFGSEHLLQGFFAGFEVGDVMDPDIEVIMPGSLTMILINAVVSSDITDEPRLAFPGVNRLLVNEALQISAIV
jgi:hypothetical protein